MRKTRATKGFVDLKHSQKNVRVSELSSMMSKAAGGEEHVVSMMMHHKTANPKLYKAIGLKERVSLTCKKMVSICVRMTGALGKAINRTLKELGIDVASNAAVQRSLQCSDHSHETMKLTRPNTNPKTNKNFPLTHGGVVRCLDVGAVLTKHINQLN